MVLQLNLNYEKNKKTNSKQHIWKISEEGLAKLKEIDIDYEKEKRNNSVAKSPQEDYNRFENIVNEVMEKCFNKKKVNSNKGETKVRIRNDFVEIYKELVKISSKGKTQRKVATRYKKIIQELDKEEVLERKAQNVQKVMRDISVTNQLSVQSFWKLRKTMSKNYRVCTSIVKDNGTEVFGAETIRNEYRLEFKTRLQHRQIDPCLRNYEEKIKQLASMYVNRAKGKHGGDYAMEELKKQIRTLKKGVAGRDKIPPELFMNAGNNILKLLLDNFNKLKNSNTIPTQWNDVAITTIYKNKGSAKRLVNHRGIFLTQVVSKLYERLNLLRIKDKIDNISKFQAGARSNRSTADQIYLINSCIDHTKYLLKPLYITIYDFKQCFDSLWIEDCIVSLWKIGIRNEVLASIYEMNKTSNIVVNTPLGQTETFKIPPAVKQGTVTGPLLCGASTGEVCEDQIGGGVQIGTATIRSLLYLDDINGLNTNVLDVKNSHNNITWFSDKKRLPLNEKKCGIMLVNGSKEDYVPTLEINNHKMESYETLEYLGDIFNKCGNNNDLIESRVRKGKGCSVNIMSMCKDITLGIHALETLILLYKSIFLPVVLYNCEAWSNLTKNDIQRLSTVQVGFLKRCLHAPKSTSNCIIYLEMGIIPIEYEIQKRQFSFLHHILTLENSDPVKQVYIQQTQYKLEKNWGNSMKELREKYEINESDEEITKLNKDKWKYMVKERINGYALKELNQQCARQKKGEKLIPYSKLIQQTYMYSLKPDQARILFQIRAGITDIKQLRTYKYTDTKCRLCKREEEDMNHILNECEQVDRSEDYIDNIYTQESKIEIKIVKRTKEFLTKVQNK